ncbi:tyrosine-type recombinase/integrase [Sulfurimonas sp.]|uniref:tyrosine-type recombinase/integrase n=1 Tax=Sulfurimonas sp. TaxID=2022749 RepID=UPI0035613146
MLKLSAVAKRKTMATIRERNGTLYLDYYINSKRIKRTTGLKDTKANRKKLEQEIIPRLMEKIYINDLRKPEHKKFSYYHEKFVKLHENDKSFHTRIGVYNKVNKFFGNMFVNEIRTLSVKEYLASLNIKNSTKKDYLGCIRGTLDIALDDEAIDKNVAFGIRFKREEKAPIHVFSVDEVSLLLEKAEGMFRNYIGIALNTGMRSGEILGLMHSDILEDRITVKRSVSKGRITSPKTLGSIRDIPMFEALKPYIESQKKLSESLYLFDFDKTFIKDASFFKRRWHQLVKDCEIEYRKLYSTRHTFITAMLNSGEFKIMEIAAIVGHSSPEMIMKNYAGFIKDNHLKINTSIDLFKKSCPKSVPLNVNKKLIEA